MVAQPVKVTRNPGCDTRQVLVMDTSSDARPSVAAGAKRSRVNFEEAAAAAAGAAPPEATLKELTARVAELERGRRNDLGWWKQCGQLVNEHTRELEELQEEALQYNDDLHVVASEAEPCAAEAKEAMTAYTDSLGRDCVESLEVSEQALVQAINDYRGECNQ